MALPVRYTFDFKSKIEQLSGSNTYTIRILDKDLGGDLNLDFETTAEGFAIQYQGDDDGFETGLKASSCSVPFIVNSAQDIAFIDLVTQTQEQRFFIEILKNGNPFWRGIIFQDQIDYELRPIPFVVDLRGSDGLGELKEIFEKGGGNNNQGANIASRFVAALSRMPSNEVWEDTDPILQTCIRWFEQNMPNTNIDPWTHTNFVDKNVTFTVDERTGEDVLISQYEILDLLLKGWNARMMQVNGRFYVIQCNEYMNASVNTFIYSKEYIDGIAPTDPGVLGSNVALNVDSTLGDTFTETYVKEAGAVYQFVGALKSASIEFSYEISNLFFRRINVDLTSLTSTFQIVAQNLNINLGLNVAGSHFIQIDDNTFAGNIYNVKIDLAITIKVGANFWNGSAWVGTASSVTVTLQDKFENNVGANNYYIPFNFNTTPPPTASLMEVQFVTAIAATSGTNTNPFKTGENTTVDIVYLNPGGGNITLDGFNVSNDLLPNSSLVLNIDDIVLGDKAAGYSELAGYRLWTLAQTASWARDAVGGAGVSINLLLCQELVHQRKTPRRKFEMNLHGAYEAFQRVTFDSRFFIMNGGIFTARNEVFACTMLELLRQDGNITNTQSNGNDNTQDPTFQIGSSNFSGINNRMNYRGNYEELTQEQQQGPFLPNDVLFQQGWLMVATTETNDPPAPQNSGSPYVLIGNQWTPVGASDSSVIYSGHQYEFTAGAFLKEVLIYPSFVGADYFHRVHLADVTDPNNITYQNIIPAALTAQVWNGVALGNFLVKAGTKLLIWLETVNSGSTTDFSDGWNYDGTQNTAGPSAESWNRRTQNNIVRFTYQSLGANYQTQLQNLIAGSTITISENGAPDNNYTYTTTGVTVDFGGVYCEIPVSLVSQNGDIPVSNPCDVTFSSPVPSPTTYIESANYWNNFPPDTVNVTPVLEFDGVDQSPGANTAFGVDIRVQNAVASPDYEVLAYSSDLAGTLPPEVTDEGSINIQGGDYNVFTFSDEIIVELLNGGNTYDLPLVADLFPIGLRFINFKNLTDEDIIIQRSGTDTIDGTTSITLSSYENVKVYYTNDEYKIV